MNANFFRELLDEKPALLKEIIRFNQTGRAPDTDSGVSAPLEAALLRHPDLLAARAERQRAEVRRFEETPHDAGAWDFEDESSRLMLLNESEAKRLFILAAAALSGDEIAHALQKAEREALLQAIGSDAYRWAILRGRFQTGSLARVFEDFAPGTPLSQRVPLLASFLLQCLSKAWSEALKARSLALQKSFTGERPATFETRAASDEALSLRRRIWFFMKKIIVRELEPSCQRYFN